MDLVRNRKAVGSTIFVYLGNSLLSSPLYALFSMLPFLLVKDLGATPLQITLIVSIKPIVAIPAYYWSSFVNRSGTSLRTSLLATTLLGLGPALLLPIIHHNWWCIFALGMFFFTDRAAMPAWMELLRLNVPEEQLGKTVGRSSLFNFLAASVLPVMVGPILDHRLGLWSWCFCFAGFLSLVRLVLLAVLKKDRTDPQRQPLRVRDALFLPWRQSFSVLRRRPDFAFFQLIFFCGGLGLMLTMAALPNFIEEVLHLTYTEAALAIALCKGIGFALANPFWSRWIYRIDLYRFCGAVTLVAASSVFMILFSPYWIGAIYLAFLTYGMMQAGSQLSWQLAGPIFSGSEESIAYSGVNVLMVGLRGFIGPWIGRLLWISIGLNTPFYVGGLICLIGTGVGWMGHRIFVRGNTASGSHTEFQL